MNFKLEADRSKWSCRKGGVLFRLVANMEK